MSLVVLSPTREGSVCDIQLVIMAMVLRTTPILSKGTDMSAGVGARHPSFCTGAGLHAAGDGLRQPPDGHHHRRLSPPAHRPSPRRGPARRLRCCCRYRCWKRSGATSLRPPPPGAPQPERCGAERAAAGGGTGAGREERGGGNVRRAQPAGEPAEGRKREGRGGRRARRRGEGIGVGGVGSGGGRKDLGRDFREMDLGNWEREERRDGGCKDLGKELGRKRERFKEGGKRLGEKGKDLGSEEKVWEARETFGEKDQSCGKTEKFGGEGEMGRRRERAAGRRSGAGAAPPVQRGSAAARRYGAPWWPRAALRWSGAVGSQLRASRGSCPVFVQSGTKGAAVSDGVKEQRSASRARCFVICTLPMGWRLCSIQLLSIKT